MTKGQMTEMMLHWTSKRLDKPWMVNTAYTKDDDYELGDSS